MRENMDQKNSEYGRFSGNGNALQNYLASQLYSSYFKSENSKIVRWKSKECLQKVLRLALLIQS